MNTSDQARAERATDLELMLVAALCEAGIRDHRRAERKLHPRAILKMMNEAHEEKCLALLELRRRGVLP